MLRKIISQSNSSLEIFEPYNEFYIDTDGNGSEFKTIDPFFTFMVGYNNEFWYFVSQRDGGVPNNRATQIYKVNSSLVIVQEYTLPLDASITSSFDVHPIATINFDSNNNQYVLREKGKNSTTNSNGHNTDWVLHKTTVAGDLTSLAIVNTISGFYSYPMLWVDGDGTDIFIAGRGTSVANQRILNMSISDDGGTTFNSYDVFNTNDTNVRSYQHIIHSTSTAEKIVGFNLRDDTNAGKIGVHLIKSSDGINWSNISDTFTKNVDTSGTISKAELDANCAIWLRASTDYNINFEGGVKKDGVVRVLISRSLLDDVVIDGNTYQTYKELRLYKYDGSWSYVDLTSIMPENYVIWGVQRTVQLSWDDTFDYITIIDKVSSPEVIRQYKSTNLFQDYTTNRTHLHPKNISL